MIPSIFVFKSKIKVCLESKKFEFLQFQKYALRITDHKTWMLKVRMVFGTIKYVKAYDL